MHLGLQLIHLLLTDDSSEMVSVGVKETFLTLLSLKRDIIARFIFIFVNGVFTEPSDNFF